jgi:predicted acylesterase/phospholipase RssA
MADVVKLSSKNRKPPSGGSRKRPEKTALVLGGGGMTGAVYEIGALRALDLLAVNRNVNEFDIYVGTSAGAFVAALAANGVTPEEMMRVVNGQETSSFRDISLGMMLRPNLLEYARTGVLLPLRLGRLARDLAPRWRHISAMDLLLGLSEDLPSGIYSGAGLEKYLKEVLSDPERTDDIRALGCELYLTATDLDSCERVVFGEDGWDDVPISRAVRASAALPMVFKPVKVKDRELVDGGIISTTNVDIAVAAGATMIVVVNPVVPLIIDQEAEEHHGLGERASHVSDMGIAQIGYQTFKLLAYQRLHEMVAQWEKKYPDVDIVLIEPEADDMLMFQTSIMDFSKRIEIARHGFQSVTVKLAEHYEEYKEIFGRHDIEISATRVKKVVKHVTREQEKTRAWRRILEQTTSTLLRQSADEPIDEIAMPSASKPASRRAASRS